MLQPCIAVWDYGIMPGESTAAAKLLQSCPTLCDHIDGLLPGSSVPGILQARTLEWVAMPSSRGSSRPRNRILSLESAAVQVDCLRHSGPLYYSLDSPGQKKAMAPHSRTLAWKIPWTEEPGRLQSMRLLRVGRD